MSDYLAPDQTLDEFNCPSCTKRASQLWHPLYIHVDEHIPVDEQTYSSSGFDASTCTACGERALWDEGTMVHPEVPLSPALAEHLPETALADFHKARLILRYSPEASAAHLRRALQAIFRHLGCPGESMRDDLDALIKRYQMDTSTHLLFLISCVRGGQEIPVGLLDERDDVACVHTLFELITVIVAGVFAG